MRPTGVFPGTKRGTGTGGRRRPGRATARVLAAACAAGAVSSCAPTGILDPRGPVAEAQRLLLLNATAIMLVVVVPVILATLAFAWWYRASNPRAARNPEMTYEGRLEFVVWSIPALIVTLLGGVIWIGSHEFDPQMPIAAAEGAAVGSSMDVSSDREDEAARVGGGADEGGFAGPAPDSAPDLGEGPLRVDVVSLDWKWLFIYPDEGVAAVNELVVPVGRPISFRLTSATVMNSFFVPQLGSQIYTMGGMITRLSLRADEPGDYTGFSANYSGGGFARMRFVVRALPEGEYASWLAKVHDEASRLDDSTFEEVARPSEAMPPETWRLVAPDLFDWIVARTAGFDLSEPPQARGAGQAASGLADGTDRAAAWCRSVARADAGRGG